MGDTKKVGSTGRFGARYGRSIRQRVLAVEKKQKKLQPCVHCGFEKARRTVAGIYRCKKCDAVFTGGAYTSSTMAGRIVGKMVKQKQFLPHIKELLEASEEKKKPLKEREETDEPGLEAAVLESADLEAPEKARKTGKKKKKEQTEQ